MSVTSKHTEAALENQGRILLGWAFFWALFLAFFVHSDIAYGDHPIDVQRRAAAGEYREALVTYQTVPKRVMTTDGTIAAAESAWALGLVTYAHELFDRVIEDPALPSDDLARVYLSKGIIEFQEGRYDSSMLFAEKASLKLPPGPLRAQAYLLWGENLERRGRIGEALARYRDAHSEADDDAKPEATFSLGRVLAEVGRGSDARAILETVPVRSPFSVEAIRLLAKIARDAKNLEESMFWLSKGRDLHPKEFLGSGIDYDMLNISLARGDFEEARAHRAEAERRYAPSDSWLTLMRAAFESASVSGSRR